MQSLIPNKTGRTAGGQNNAISAGKVLLLTVILSLVVRGGFFLKIAPWREDVVANKILVADAGGYDRLARSILSTGNFSEFGVFRTPGYPLFIAFLYAVFGTKVWVVLLAQVVADVLTTALVFLIAQVLFESVPVSAIASLLYAVNPLTSYYCTQLLSEIVFAFVFTLSILCFVQLLKSWAAKYAILSGAALAAATYVRPVSQFFIAVPALCMLAGEARLSKKILNAAIILSVFAALLGIWQYRNYRYYGHWRLCNTGGIAVFDGVSLVKAQCEGKDLYQVRQEMLLSQEIPASRKLKIRAASFADTREELMWAPRNGTDLFAEADVWQEIAITYAKAHPKEILKSFARATVPFFFSNGQANLKEVFGKYGAILNGIFSGITGLEYALVAIGAMVMLSNKNYRMYLLFFFLMAIYFWGITGLLSYSRYRIPIVPLCLVISAYGMMESYYFIKRRLCSNK